MLSRGVRGLAPDDLLRAFPHLDDDQRIAVLELFDLLFGEDLRASIPTPESVVRTEAILRAVADLLHGMLVASRIGAPS